MSSSPAVLSKYLIETIFDGETMTHNNLEVCWNAFVSALLINWTNKFHICHNSVVIGKCVQIDRPDKTLEKNIIILVTCDAIHHRRDHCVMQSIHHARHVTSARDRFSFSKPPSQGDTAVLSLLH